MDGGAALLFLESCAAAKGNQASSHCHCDFLVRFLFALSAYLRRFIAFSEFHLQCLLVASGGNTLSAAGSSRKFRGTRCSAPRAVSGAYDCCRGLFLAPSKKA